MVVCNNNRVFVVFVILRESPQVAEAVVAEDLLGCATHEWSQSCALPEPMTRPKWVHIVGICLPFVLVPGSAKAVET